MFWHLKTLLRSMAAPGTFYVLGSGASVGLVPFTPGLREGVKKAYWSLGMYPAAPAIPTDLFRRVVGGYRAGSGRDSAEVALQSIPQSALELAVQKELTPVLVSKVPPQYALLQRIGAPSFIFTFNLDRYARVYLAGKHVVFHPHGLVDWEWTEAPDYSELLELTLDVTLPSFRPKLLPGPEPTSITSASPCVRAARPLRQASSCIVLGYSFGKRDDGGLDDSESFEYVVEHLKASTGVVLVVSREPVELAALLDERLGARRALPVVLYWDVFARCFMSLMAPHERICDWMCDEQIHVLRRSYFEALETEQPER